MNTLKTIAFTIFIVVGLSYFIARGLDIDHSRALYISHCVPEYYKVYAIEDITVVEYQAEDYATWQEVCAQVGNVVIADVVGIKIKRP